MKMTIDAGIMKDMFKNYDRDYFTYEACKALNDYYDEVDPDTEFDPIAICCDWSEYGDTPCLTWKDLFNDYGYLVSSDYKDYSDKLDGYAIEKMSENRSYIDSIENDDTLARLFDELEGIEE